MRLFDLWHVPLFHSRTFWFIDRRLLFLLNMPRLVLILSSRLRSKFLLQVSAFRRLIKSHNSYVFLLKRNALVSTLVYSTFFRSTLHWGKVFERSVSINFDFRSLVDIYELELITQTMSTIDYIVCICLRSTCHVSDAMSADVVSTAWRNKDRIEIP